MRGLSISSTIAADPLSISSIQEDHNSENVSIAGSLASEVTRNAAKTMSTISKFGQFRKRLSRSSMIMDVEASSINVPSRTDEPGTKVYSESMPAMTTTTVTVSQNCLKSEKKSCTVCLN